MIQLESIQIENFRGIKRLKLNLRRKNFAVTGPNGAGKSGVIDAIDFGLTGNISRLTGEGTGGLTLKEHGPHVDTKATPKAAVVRLSVHIASLNKAATIERNLAAPNTPKISPNTPEIAEVFSRVASHPEVVLSRREIIKYVLAEPGRRSKEVQALLKLENVERLRTSLTSVSNKLRNEYDAADADADAAGRDLAGALNIPKPTSAATLEAVNDRRRLLGLADLPDLQPERLLTEGIVEPVAAAGAAPTITVNKALAAQEVALLGTTFEGGWSRDVSELEVSQLVAELDKLAAAPDLLVALRMHSFVEAGLGLVDHDACPLCDTPWSVDDLRGYLRKKLERAGQAKGIVGHVQALVEKLRVANSNVVRLLNTGARHASSLGDVAISDQLKQWAGERGERTAAFDDIGALVTLRQALRDGWFNPPAGFAPVLDKLKARIAAIPEASSLDQAKSTLIIAQDRLSRFRQRRREAQRKKVAADGAKTILTAYGEAVEAVLGSLYQRVEAVFARLYAAINSEDESGFKARLAPSPGKLLLEVDFYTRGLFPPGAYHSEGHQDAMGLCLYLALMREVLGPELTFVVLDDVVMSVDMGHRRALCELLKKEFGKTQFIITTHDTVWSKFMQSTALVPSGNAVQFRQWSVDHGPSVSEAGDAWAEIDRKAAENDIPGAAGDLRRHLEFVSAELAERLGAAVQFRGDAQHELGDLLPSVIRRVKDLLERAKKVAREWQREQEVRAIEERLGDFSAKVQKSNAEQWAINKTVHYNEWAVLTPGEFRTVADSFRALLDALRCAKCGEWLRMSPLRGEADSVRCECGEINLNVRK